MVDWVSDPSGEKQYLEGIVWRAREQQDLWDHHSPLQATQSPEGPSHGTPVRLTGGQEQQPERGKGEQDMCLWEQLSS